MMNVKMATRTTVSALGVMETNLWSLALRRTLAKTLTACLQLLRGSGSVWSDQDLNPGPLVFEADV